jgi:hypothetical protein
MTIRLLIFLVLMTCSALGQANIRYYVQDEFKSADLDYVIERDCIVYDWAAPQEMPCLQYFVRFRVSGCARNSFTFEEEAYNKRFSREESKDLLNIVRHANLLKLGFVAGPSCLLGWLEFDGKQHDFKTPLGNPARDKLQADILSYLDRVAPKSKREVTIHRIEGDFQPTRDVTVSQLLAAPGQFDGKRVRITGYYHREFEDSSLYDMKGDDFKKAVWVDGQSTFAKENDLHWTDDGHATIEGTFMKGPGGHMGAFAGEVQRVTKFISLDPPAPPPPPASQSSKRKQLNPGPPN